MDGEMGADAPKKKLTGKNIAAWAVVGFVGLLIVGAMNGHDDATNATANAAAPAAPSNGTTETASDAAAATPAPPPHNWQYREGREYGYSSALSDDDKKSGQAAASIMMYRYLGEKNGAYVIATSSPLGPVYASCANPCEVVKISSNGATQRFEFNADSVVGAALTDAMNGQMEVYRPTHASQETAEGE